MWPRLSRFRGNARLILIGLFIIVVCNEYLIYIFNSYSWPSLPSKGQGQGPSIRVLFIADPQIQGYRNEPGWPIGALTRGDSDNYLQRNFRLVMSHFKPDLLVFLGDLFDEGSIASDSEFRTYFHRFSALFKCDKPQLYLPGDNDIGGENELVSASKVERYIRYFGSLRGLSKFGHVDFLRASVNYQDDHTTLVRDELSHFLLQRNTSHVLIALNHLNLVPRRYLSAFLRQSQVSFVFSGDSHQSRMWRVYPSGAEETLFSFWKRDDYSSFPIDRDATIEISVPSCSYRMGSANMGYGAAIIGQKEIWYAVFWLPRRYMVLASYPLFIFILLYAANVFR